MASYRKPKGTYVRPSPDWFINQLASGSWYNDQQVGTQYASIGLFNNDTLGRKFYIYGISVGTFNANTAYGVVLNGTFGSLVTSCVSVDASLPAPPGQIYFTRFGPAAPPNVTLAQPAGTRFNLGSGYTKVDVFQDWPICVLPVGYSLNIQSSLQSAEWSTSFWYVPFPGA